MLRFSRLISSAASAARSAIATTLLDPLRYPAKEIAALYSQRWRIETNFRHLKTTLKMEVPHCKSVQGVNKELAVYALVYNLVRQVILAAAEKQQVPVDRISFVDPARWLAESKYGHRPLKLELAPSRPGRAEPRAVKRRPKQYDRLNRPRRRYRKRLKNRRMAAQVSGIRNCPLFC